MSGQRYRLVTRSDFDGLVCAVLLRAKDLIDDIVFVHPKDVQDGLVEVTERDILTNLPYAPRAHLVFDHHSSEALRNAAGAANHVLHPAAPSAARVVHDHFGGAARFPGVSADLMAAVDQADSAAYGLEDVLRPTGWALLNYLMDSRTGTSPASRHSGRRVDELGAAGVSGRPRSCGLAAPRPGRRRGSRPLPGRWHG